MAVEVSKTFPPRGHWDPKAKSGVQRATWTDPSTLGPEWDATATKVIVGAWGDRLIAEPDRQWVGRGSGDDRHIVTIAGSRAGKSSTVLVPNLLNYRGSALVIDPKGELAKETSEHRRDALGQNVVILDPFHTTELSQSTFNPLDELDSSRDTFIDDVAQVADALIVEATRDTHWTDAAKILVRGLILYMSATGDCTFPRLWSILCGDEGRLITSEFSDPLADETLFWRMAKMDDVFGGRLSSIGSSFATKSEREMSAILSTAQTQLVFLDSDLLAACCVSSDIRLAMLKTRPTTIYLCLPATRLSTHSRWLRVIVTMALSAMENGGRPPPQPVLFMLEEFAALGYMRPIEYATGFMAGFGVKLWTVLQDLSQLSTHYQKSWQTFLGNAGLIQAFGNADHATTDHLSKMMGSIRVREQRDDFVSSTARLQGDSGIRDDYQNVSLIAASEISLHFARETNRQLILIPGRGQLFLNRLPHPKSAATKHP